MAQAAPNYTLTANGAGAFAALLQAEGALAPARQHRAQAQFSSFFGAIDTIAYDYYKVLVSDASYQTTDPYNPGSGFSVRQTDMPATLNRARASLPR